MNDKYIEDCLVIGMDVSPMENNIMTVARMQNCNIEIINMFKDDEALELYNKLIGVKDGQINKMG